MDSDSIPDSSPLFTELRIGPEWDVPESELARNELSWTQSRVHKNGSLTQMFLQATLLVVNSLIHEWSYTVK